MLYRIKYLIKLNFVFFFAAQGKFVLMIPLYNEPNINRVNEYISCLQHNVIHKGVEKIHVFYDTSRDHETIKKHILNALRRHKVHITHMKGRLTYGQCFKVANEMYSDKKVIIANADIYFDNTLRQLETFSLENKLLALTRWNLLEGGELSLEYTGSIPAEFSQDAWIFNAPIREVVGADQVYLGMHYCETKLLQCLIDAGLHISNPCLSVRCIHVHRSAIRTWTPGKGPAEIIRVPWCILQDNS